MDNVKKITVQRIGQIAYVYFNFNDGVMNTQQCFVLKQAIAQIKHTDVKIIVLMGGENHWCNGINSRNIQLSPRPDVEREQNVSAMDDLVQEVASINTQVTVAAIRTNLDAGGLALALACDKMVVMQDVVFNKDSQEIDFYNETSHLLLNNAIGKETAKTMMVKKYPYLAAELLQMGMADKLFGSDWATFNASLYAYCEQLVDSVGIEAFLSERFKQYQDIQLSSVIAKTRLNTLAYMQKSFQNIDYYHMQNQFNYQMSVNSI